MASWRSILNDNTSNKTITMSMDHIIYNNHGSMGRYCGNYDWGICKAITSKRIQASTKNATKSIILNAVALSLL